MDEWMDGLAGWMNRQRIDNGWMNEWMDGRRRSGNVLDGWLWQNGHTDRWWINVRTDRPMDMQDREVSTLHRLWQRATPFPPHPDPTQPHTQGGVSLHSCIWRPSPSSSRARWWSHGGTSWTVKTMEIYITIAMLLRVQDSCGRMGLSTCWASMIYSSPCCKTVVDPKGATLG